jgi:hypothetical protein
MKTKLKMTDRGSTKGYFMMNGSIFWHNGKIVSLFNKIGKVSMRKNQSICNRNFLINFSNQTSLNS